MNTLGLEFSPISDAPNSLATADNEQKLIMEGTRRLHDLQQAPVPGVIDEMSKLYPDGLPWETWRRSTNVEDFRDVKRKKKKE